MRHHYAVYTLLSGGWVCDGCYGTRAEALRRARECGYDPQLGDDFYRTRVRRRRTPEGYAVINEGLAFVGT